MKGSWVGFFHILSLCKVNIGLCKRDSLLTYERWKLLKPTDTKLKLLNVSLEKPVDRSIEEAEPRSVQSQIQDIYFWGSKWALIIFRKILLPSKTRLLPPLREIASRDLLNLDSYYFEEPGRKAGTSDLVATMSHRRLCFWDEIS